MRSDSGVWAQTDKDTDRISVLKIFRKSGFLMWRMGLGSVVGNGHKKLWILKGYQIIKVRKNGEAIGF